MRAWCLLLWILTMACIVSPAARADRNPASLTLSELATSAVQDHRVALPDAHLTTPPGARRGGALRPQTVLIKLAGDRHVSVLAVPAGEERAAVAVLRARPDVAFAEVDALMTRQSGADDPLLPQQWHHGQIGSGEAWAYAPGNSVIKVAIVDSPFQMDHPDLSGNTENGWDVVNETVVTPSQIPGVYAYDNHATASAGMAAAVVSNALGVAGAGNCRVLPIRINGYVSEMYNATVWAASNGVRIVNISWDGADSPTLNEAGRFLRETVDGILVMAGVNGSGWLDYTNHPYITCVSMTDDSDALRSHYGPHIDFAAPGWDVLSTRTVSEYGTAQGTSFAAPLVSGVLGALLAVSPSLNAADALAALRASAADLGAPGWDEHFGWGRVDFGTAAWLISVGAGLFPELMITDVEVATNTVVSVDHRRGLRYQLEGASSVNGTNWTTVSCSIATNGGLVRLSNSTTNGVGFYRVRGLFP